MNSISCKQDRIRPRLRGDLGYEHTAATLAHCPSCQMALGFVLGNLNPYQLAPLDVHALAALQSRYANH
jgi:hypothetical protein